ncbi:DUF3427 domain-containing protein [Tannockella kyphosi]|uniref:DUF3427 domain-containing protein n=1 Tax=Tannockella kyphosi TaxID=2899121 RepID=UPI002013370F|nr:DEAD/DEAH box helicase [Tannockella kyphosi]
MSNKVIQEIKDGLEIAFIDAASKKTSSYKPEFVSNNYKERKRVLTTLETEFNRCEEFIISVAFVTQSGLVQLLETLRVLEQKGIKGRVLTTDYLMFTDPKALHKLNSYRNIELRMYESGNVGFHTKGYIFKNDSNYTVIVGSSNLTAKALSVNKEWNTKVTSTSQGEYIHHILEEFEELWVSEDTYQFNEFIENYEIEYAKKKVIAKKEEQTIIYDLKPNEMQQKVIHNYQELLKKGEKRGLLISATGTGKTYAAAFSMFEQNPKKVLFIVHREQIAKQAIKSFKNIFGNTKTFGLLSGTSKETNVDYLFSTMNMMAKEEVYSKFDKSEFDVIIIDEVHRAGSLSYNSIMKYFLPSFYFGMTASPERMDGIDIYGMFDHNIIYEIRLQQAMEADMLCPFHYFGVTDFHVDGEVLINKQSDFNDLICEERVDYIMEKAAYYGYSGDRVKGLMFCSRNEEAKELSEKMNERGLSTLVLSGSDSQEKREIAIQRLVSDHRNDKLDYLLTVDIFNEGVDIPEVNQVVMLRPTQSPTVFVQQLGRGLRKDNEKDYVVILDFIGNYETNFMIPIALYGDRSFNKDTIRRFVMEGERIIPGTSTIHFDAIAKKKIFESIDAANFSVVRLIKENYTNLKNKIGKIPTLMDFEIYGEMDVQCIFDHQTLGSYYKFLVKYEKDYVVRLSPVEDRMIEFISKKLLNAKRVHELEMLSILLDGKDVETTFKEVMQTKHNIVVSGNTIENVVNVLSANFITGISTKTYQDCCFVVKTSDGVKISDEFSNYLNNYNFKEMIVELIAYGKYRYHKYYSNRYLNSSLVLYQKYTYEDVCRLLEWHQSIVAQNIGGYLYNEKTRTFPVFINYEKDSDINDETRYEDRFISSDKIIAISKQNKNLLSKDVQMFLGAKKENIKVDLFVRKNKDDKTAKEFYYLGRMNATGKAEEVVMPNTKVSVVEIEWQLETPIREDVYRYITEK